MTSTLKWWIATVGIIATGITYFLVNPAEAKWVPQCLFLNLTGRKCPGCGSQRMIHALLNGNIADAWRFNPLLFIALPIIVALFFLEIYRKKYPGLYNKIYRPGVILSVLAVIIAWWIIRNILEI